MEPCMSVTLRYSGTLKDLGLLPRLREEFQDIATTNGWPVDVLERTVPKGRPAGGRLMAPPLAVEGLKLVVHPQTDPLWLTFDEKGALTRLDPYPLGLGGSAPRYGFLQQDQASMQTSIGGSELHRQVVGLLDYLKKAYLPDLQVHDDSGYWDDRDDAALSRLMDR
jgi:hypothetical protein